MDEEEAVALVVNGFCKDVLQALPMEFLWKRSSSWQYLLKVPLDSCDYNFIVIVTTKVTHCW
jgi:hypothetical protein